MKKILIFNNTGMGYEGMSSVIMNYLENMDKSDLEIVIATFSNTEKKLIDRLSKYSKIIILPNRKKNLLKYIFSLKSELSKGYDVFHIHGNSGTMIIEVIIAKLCKIKKIITHAHNTRCSHPIINAIFKKRMSSLADVRLSCSYESGKWLYNNYNYIVLNNAIDLDSYSLNLEKRKKLRRKLNLDDEFIIGHSGRFSQQKNHPYLIDIFYEFQKKYQNSKLILLSDGPDYEKIVTKVKELCIQNKVIFLGRRSDANLFYQVMDCFVLPSRWEGLPLVALEAQASNLPTYLSDNITKDAKCNSNVKFISIESSPSYWADIIYKDFMKGYNREEGINLQMVGSEFDIKSEASKLRKIYLGD